MELPATTTGPDSLDGTTQQRKRRLKLLALLTDQPLWKTQAAASFDVSVQTIGRDIDALHRDGLLTDTAVAAEEGRRHHYIGYTTTPDGEQVLDRYRMCQHCGDVVNTAEECVHDYGPIEADRDHAPG